MAIEYRINAAVSAGEFADLLRRSTLAARRPVDDEECLQGMVGNSNLFVSAWEGDVLVGVARSVSDFHYACYLSDLAVCRSRQQQGIGKELIRLTQQQLGPQCKLILLAAPAASEYYQPLGFTANPRAWVLERSTEIP